MEVIDKGVKSAKELDKKRDVMEAKPIQMEKVESSNIEEIGWCPQNNVLRIRFDGGAEYEYEPVPAVMWTKFRVAESKGRFFSANIRHDKSIICKKVKDKDNATL